jgi:hypothetical protein
LIDSGLEFLSRGGEVLEEFDFVIEVDEEGFVFVFAEDVVEEGSAGGAFLIENAALAEAGVDEEAKGKREIGFFGEVGDGLGFGVLLEGEIVLGEIADQVAAFVADSGDEINGGNVYGDGGLLVGERKSGEEEGKESCRTFPHFRSSCLSGMVGCQCLFPGWGGKSSQGERRKNGITQRVQRKSSEDTEE